MTEAPSGEPLRGSYRRYIVPSVVVGSLLLAYVLRGVLVPFFIAFLVAYALDPLVDKLERLRVPRPAGALLVMAASGTLMVITALLAIPVLFAEFAEAAQRLPEQLAWAHDRFDGWVWARFHYKLPTTFGELAAKYGSTLREHAPDAGTLLSSVNGALFGTVNAIFVVLGLLIVPVFALYILIDFDRIAARAHELVPRRWAKKVERVAAEIHNTLGRYVRGQILANLVLSVLYAGGLAAVDLRLGVAIGILTGMLSFVPYVGLALGTTLAVLMSLLDWHSSSQVFQVCAVMAVVGVLDGMVITPRIVGGSVGLKPIEVLLTMMAAGTLFGFVGIVLAVPLGAVLKIVVGHGIEAYLQSPFYRSRGGTAPSNPPEPAPENIASTATSPGET